MKKLALITLAILINIIAFAQTDSTKKWTLNGDVGLNTSQVSFANWAQGGENSVAGMGFLHLNGNYKHSIWYWENYFGSEFGLMQQGTDGTKKSNDLVEYKTKVGRALSEKMFLTFLILFYYLLYSYVKILLPLLYQTLHHQNILIPDKVIFHQFLLNLLDKQNNIYLELYRFFCFWFLFCSIHIHFS